MPTLVSCGRSIFAVLALHATLASAELWGYVDDDGVAHFATHRVDERYQLFFKGPTSLDAPDRSTPNAQAPLEHSALYRRVIEHPNARRFASLIERNAQKHALDPALVKAIIAVESAFEPQAISAKGALGLMQIIPATGARYGLADQRNRTIAQQLFDPPTNVRIGVRYLRDLLDLFGDDVPLALAAYNAGEQSVRDNGNRIPPFPETREYVGLVRQFQAMYRPVEPAPPAMTRPRVDLGLARDSRPPNVRAP
ncbi:MAG TPA: lytic transglycosylase domain-containing protein [Casimicrobiaceae bacterium]|jgi:soluble lytic murein transglycosylase-like protein